MVHGSGSFGHPIVKKFNLHKGMQSLKQKLAYGKTIRNMLDLNGVIISSFLSASVPVVSLPPRGFVTQSGGRFKGFDCEIVVESLEQGLVPVLFGDAVLDDEWGCSILSGDTIVSYLAQKLKARSVIFLSDVEGIFDSDPRVNKTARLIPDITNDNLDQVLKVLKPENRLESNNVTGEMYGKIMAIKANLRGTEVLLANGFKPNILSQIIDSKRVGSRVYFV